MHREHDGYFQQGFNNPLQIAVAIIQALRLSQGHVIIQPPPPPPPPPPVKPIPLIALPKPPAAKKPPSYDLRLDPVYDAYV